LLQSLFNDLASRCNRDEHHREADHKPSLTPILYLLPKGRISQMTGFHILPRTVRCLWLAAALCGVVPSVQGQSLGSVLSFEFGKIAVNSAGTVILSTTANTRTKTGGAVLVAGSTVRRGRVVVSGTASTPVNITLPSSIVLTGSGGGTATLTPAINGGTPQTLSAAGNLTVRFGGTLTFTGPQPTGTYTATVPVTVIY
jgi:Domain of unknown function (DUF4402)